LKPVASYLIATRITMTETIATAATVITGCTSANSYICAIISASLPPA
jgi:hypothetical protein